MDHHQAAAAPGHGPGHEALQHPEGLFPRAAVQIDPGLDGQVAAPQSAREPTIDPVCPRVPGLAGRLDDERPGSEARAGLGRRPVRRRLDAGVDRGVASPPSAGPRRHAAGTSQTLDPPHRFQKSRFLCALLSGLAGALRSVSLLAHGLANRLAHGGNTAVGRESQRSMDAVSTPQRNAPPTWAALGSYRPLNRPGDAPAEAASRRS